MIPEGAPLVLVRRMDHFLAIARFNAKHSRKTTTPKCFICMDEPKPFDPIERRFFECPCNGMKEALNG